MSRKRRHSSRGPRSFAPPPDTAGGGPANLPPGAHDPDLLAELRSTLRESHPLSLLMLASSVLTVTDSRGANRDVQDFTRHADPRTAMRYDRNRDSLDRHATHAIAQYIAGSEEKIRALLAVASGSVTGSAVPSG